MTDQDKLKQIASSLLEHPPRWEQTSNGYRAAFPNVAVEVEADPYYVIRIRSYNDTELACLYADGSDTTVDALIYRVYYAAAQYVKTCYNSALDELLGFIVSKKE